mmetsp:Transcript_3494/g.10810  ORF Transcript_3494/g.10810 Transcript_3494/m.10810 type:complete len:746 (+) Transcript_3494:757-2994(+)
MNGEKYVLSLTPNGKDAATKFPYNFKDFPGGVEYFDVYSPPITSLYSQVFWTGLEPVDLPADIVQRYDGKGMAVVGFEVDQVRKTPEGDVSVPINVAYNHHFESNMIGKKSKLEKIVFDGPNDPRREALAAEMGHGVPYHSHYVVRDLAPGNPLPTSQGFGAGNGGEYRMSYHGYAPGYVQVIESPTQFQMTPMQIDTWHREKMNLTGSPFYQGPVPRNSWAPPTGSPASLYSGLLECPLTTRIRKVVDAAYKADTAPCAADSVIDTSAECFAAATKLFNAAGGVDLVNEAIADAGQPAGCTASGVLANGSIVVTFNAAANSTAKCAAAGGLTQTAGKTDSLVSVMVSLDAAADKATITLTGPAGVWFGVGFNAQAMKDAPWAIIVDGSGMVTERKLEDQSPGTQLSKSVTVVSSSTAGGNRTVVLTRPLKGLTADHYTFSLEGDLNLPFINAVGSGPMLAFHKAKLPATLSLLPVGAGACVCALAPAPFGQGKGKLEYVQTAQPADVGEGTISFGNKCAPQPRSDLLAMHNPTCDVRSYVGGQTACHHMFSLLDADQQIPWVDQPLVYHQKFRFWVQPYNASYHTNVKRTTWGIASPVEFDVPKCAPGVMGCEKDPKTGSWVHTIRGTYGGGGKLVAAHFHCHAPTCLEMSMYRCNMSQVSECNATTGELICSEFPIYGGTGAIANKTFDEPGYITQPPCLWGDAEFGLEAPVDTSGYTLHSVHRSNADYGHHGEMAWQQMFFV